MLTWNYTRLRTYIRDRVGDCSEALIVHVETTFYSIGNGTKVSLAWLGKGKLLFLKLLLPFMRGKIIMQATAELERFKELVETCGVDFSKSPNKSN